MAHPNSDEMRNALQRAVEHADDRFTNVDYIVVKGEADGAMVARSRHGLGSVIYDVIAYAHTEFDARRIAETLTIVDNA